MPNATVVARELERLVGVDAVQVEAVSRLGCGGVARSHGGRPHAVALPRTIEQVTAVLSYAEQRRIALVPRGAGTALTAASIPPGAIVLGLSRMDRLAELDPDARLAVAGPGLSIGRLDAAAGAHELRYPSERRAHPSTTLGGSVAARSGARGGPAHRAARDEVLALQVVLPGGEVIRSGGLLGTAAGYDLTRLLCGSEGTLGVITEVTVRLAPVPQSTATGLACFASAADAGRAVAALRRLRRPPAMLEFLDRTCADAVERLTGLGLCGGAGALLVFEQDGDAGAVARDIAAMAAACRDADATSVTIAESAEEADRLLEIHRRVLPALAALAPGTMLVDAYVPVDRTVAFAERVTEIAGRYGVQIAIFGEAGGGVLHPTCLLDHGDEDVLACARDAFSEILELAGDLGGAVTGEHGDARTQLPLLERQLGADQSALLWRVKRAFDPHQILSPSALGS